MSVAPQYPEYGDLHRLVDRLTPRQARARRAAALVLIKGDGDDADPQAEGGPGRRLSFIGAMDAEPDLATRSQEILRDNSWCPRRWSPRSATS